MEMHNLVEHENKLISKKSVEFTMNHDKNSTPKKETLKQDIAKKYHTQPELVNIRHVYTNFGKSQSKVVASIYADEKTLKLLEPRKGKKVKAAAAPGAK